MDKFHIGLHLQVQYCAKYNQDGSIGRTHSGPQIGGGGDVVDDAVKELARRVGVDAVVLDRVQLAAGSVVGFRLGAPSLVSVYFS